MAAANYLADIRANLVIVLKTVKKTNGYNLDLVDDRIYADFDPDILKGNRYPKVFIQFNEAEIERMPSKLVVRELKLSIILIDRKSGVRGDAIGVVIEKRIADIESVLLANHDLSNTVQDVLLTKFVTDSGVAFPEGVAIFDIVITYSTT